VLYDLSLFFSARNSRAPSTVLLAANRGSNCSFMRAMDGRIVRCGIISSCRSAATSEIIKRFWSRVCLTQEALKQVLDFTFTFTDRRKTLPQHGGKCLLLYSLGPKIWGLPHFPKKIEDQKPCSIRRDFRQLSTSMFAVLLAVLKRSNERTKEFVFRISQFLSAAVLNK